MLFLFVQSGTTVFPNISNANCCSINFRHWIIILVV